MQMKLEFYNKVLHFSHFYVLDSCSLYIAQLSNIVLYLKILSINIPLGEMRFSVGFASVEGRMGQGEVDWFMCRVKTHCGCCA